MPLVFSQGVFRCEALGNEPETSVSPPQFPTPQRLPNCHPNLILVLRRTVYALLLWASFGSLWAQPVQTLTRIPADLPPNSEVFVFSDEEGALLLFQEGQEAEVLQLNSDLEVQHRFRVLGFPDETDMERLGFTYDEGELTVCYQSREDSEVVALWITPEEEGSQRVEMGLRQLLKGSTPWDNFTYEGSLHMLRFARGQGEIRLCRFEGGDEFQTLSFPLENADLLRGRRLQFSRLDSLDISQLEKTYARTKMYLRGADLYFSLDQDNGTYLIHINLEEESVEEYMVRLDLGENLAQHTASLLTPNFLYQAALLDQELYWWAHSLNYLQPGNTTAPAPMPLQLPETVDTYWVKPSGLEPTQLAPVELWAAWEEAPYFGIAQQITGDDIENPALQLAAVWPLQGHGLTGMVVSESVQSLLWTAYVDPFTGRLNTESQPIPLLSEVQAPRTPAHARSFQMGNRTFWGYYDATSGTYVIGE